MRRPGNNFSPENHFSPDSFLWKKENESGSREVADENEGVEKVQGYPSGKDASVSAEKESHLKILRAALDAPDESVRPDSPFPESKNPELNTMYAQLAGTRGLEFNSPRTDILQGLVDKMLSGQEESSQVIIMNKGRGNEAFVCPEGKIFISQHIINQCRNLDEVGAILAHECGHVQLGTAKRRAQATSGIENLGVSWTHEGLSDFLIKENLSRAGLSTVGSNVCSRVMGHKRGGVSHMAGGVRSSLIAGTEKILDYGEASERPPQPLPEGFHREAKFTNLEITKDLLAVEGWSENLEGCISKLDNYDFGTFFSGNWRMNREFFNDSTLEKSSDFLFQELKLRTERLGIFEDAKTKVFLTAWAAHFFPERSNKEYYKNEYSWPFLDKSVLLQEQEVIPMHEDPWKLGDKIFGGTARFIPSEISPFLYGILSVSAYDSSKYQAKREGVGFSEISDLLSFLSKIPGDSIPYNDDLKYSRRFNFEAVYRWVLTSVTSKQENSLVLDQDFEQKINAVVNECVKSGIEFSWDYIDPKGWAQDFKLDIKDGSDSFAVNPNDAERVLESLRSGLGLNNQKAEEEPKDRIAVGVENVKSYLKECSFHHKNFNMEDFVKFSYHDSFSRLVFDIQRDSREQLRLMEGIDEVLQSWEINPQALESFYSNLTGEKDFQDPEAATKLVKLVFREVLGSKAFSSDSPEYYSWQGRQPFGAYDWGQSSTALLKRLVISISGRLKKANNPTAFSNLPIIKEYLSRVDNIEFSFEPDNINSIKYPKKLNSFEMTPADILLGRNNREELLQLVKSELKDDDLEKLYALVNYDLPSGPEKKRWLSAIKLRYLKSSEVSFEKKVEYLEDNLIGVGAEGVILMADQATTAEQFSYLREKTGDAAKVFLEGNQYSTFGALADYTISLGLSELESNVSSAERLIDTCASDDRTVRDKSTAAVSLWFENFPLAFKEATRGEVVYDRDSGKFFVDEVFLTKFNSPHDIIDSLHQASQSERFFSVLKTLVDDGGSLNSPAGREKLSSLAVERLNLEGFMKELFTTLLEKGDREQISVPLASLFAPLLFRSIDINKVDYKKLENNLSSDWLENSSDDLTSAEIKKITTATTRTLVEYGASYRDHSESALVVEARKSWDVYQQVGDRLNEILKDATPENAAKSPESPELISTADGLIRAGETNPLTNRAMQLAVQLFPELSPDLREKMSECLDSNPVVTKWMFWENLSRLEKRSRDGENKELSDHIKRIKQIGDRAGAGSLFTTYFGEYETPTGDNRSVVVKLLNPNPVKQVEENFNTLFKALGDVMATTTDRKVQNIAGKSKSVLNMTREWCLRDIRDKNFLTDDNSFRETASGFNAKLGREAVKVPTVYVDNQYLKIEDRASGETLKEFLKSTAVSEEQKKEARQLVRDFYEYQLTQPTASGDFIIHSDPHTGNFIVELGDDGRPVLNIIDRSMYLRFREESLKPFRELLAKDSVRFGRDYVSGLCRRRSGSKAANLRVYARVMAALAKEKMRRGDDLDMLISVNDALVKSGVEVPLDWQLLVRNVRLVNELQSPGQ